MRLTTRHSIAMLGIVMSTSCAPEHRAAPETPAWLLDRAKEQRVLAMSSSVFQDFQFRDELEKSGITFVNRVVDDASRSYKKVHYDHGSGVCAADVDGDGLID